ncbi:E3 ubiquitin-protein ligase RBBP6-like [Balearica regulorum gibbericeps]|uniref:E3 ubiquitin-protein ligase RBBP6-like n=1 Tax=Balearica regulorum gibbericeps TaxID=100784 RepID=UPI003F647D1E
MGWSTPLTVEPPTGGVTPVLRSKMTCSATQAADATLQRREEYTDENALIPKSSSVIVRRIPAGGAKATSKRHVLAHKSPKILGSPFRSRTEPGSGTSKAVDESSASTSLAQLIK